MPEEGTEKREEERSQFLGLGVAAGNKWRELFGSNPISVTLALGQETPAAGADLHGRDEATRQPAVDFILARLRKVTDK